MSDAVNHPAHYTGHPAGVECIAVVRHMDFTLGNAVKYLWRAGLKCPARADLEKAAWYVRDALAQDARAVKVTATNDYAALIDDAGKVFAGLVGKPWHVVAKGFARATGEAMFMLWMANGMPASDAARAVFLGNAEDIIAGLIAGHAT